MQKTRCKCQKGLLDNRLYGDCKEGAPPSILGLDGAAMELIYMVVLVCPIDFLIIRILARLINSLKTPT